MSTKRKKPEAKAGAATGADWMMDLWLQQIYATHLMHFNLLSCQFAQTSRYAYVCVPYE